MSSSWSGQPSPWRGVARFLYELFVFVLLVTTVIALCSLVAFQP